MQLFLGEAQRVDARELVEEFALLALVRRNHRFDGGVQRLGDLGVLRQQQGNSAEATSWLERASNENPELAAPAVRLVAQYLRTGDKAKALTTARKFHTSHPTSPELLDQLGQAQMANNDPNAALDTYSKLVNLAPKSAQPHLRLAQVHAMLKNEAGVNEDIKRALALDPNNIQAQIAQIDIAARKGQLDQALVMVRKLQKQDDKAAYTCSKATCWRCRRSRRWH